MSGKINFGESVRMIKWHRLQIVKIGTKVKFGFCYFSSSSSFSCSESLVCDNKNSIKWHRKQTARQCRTLFSSVVELCMSFCCVCRMHATDIFIFDSLNRANNIYVYTSYSCELCVCVSVAVCFFITQNLVRILLVFVN